MDFNALLSATGGTIWILVFFVIALSVIVAIHEFGHYIVGRWCGIHADVFSVGFGKALLTSVDKRGTRWQIAALPFGGYVKFRGDADAASVTSDEVASDIDPRTTMTHAPLWARALTIAAGPVFNFIFAVMIFAGFQMWNGEVTTPLTYGSSKALPDSYVSELMPGDEILGIDGFEISELGEFLENTSELLTSRRTMNYQVRRDGEIMTVQGPHPNLPRASSISPRSAADDAGLRIGDVILKVNGEDVHSLGDVIRIKDANFGAPLALVLDRDGETFEATMTPRRVDFPAADGTFETRYVIGFVGGWFFEPEVKPVGIVDAFMRGSEELWLRIYWSLRGMWEMITGSISSCNLSGPVGIAQTSGSMAQQGTDSFVLFIGVLSAAVGLLNLFPIPVLDGGHLVFHAYEAVARRKPSERVMNALMFLGVGIIGAFMVFALLNDLVLCP